MIDKAAVLALENVRACDCPTCDRYSAEAITEAYRPLVEAAIAMLEPRKDWKGNEWEQLRASLHKCVGSPSPIADKPPESTSGDSE